MLNEITIDRTSGAPVYRQVEMRLLEWIEQGELRPGDRLPSLRVLSDKLGITHVTARQAIKGLIDRGVVVSRQGQGTFVSQRDMTNLEIALIVPNLAMHQCAGISRGVGRISETHDCHVTVLDSHDDPEVEIRNLRRVRDSACAGVIIYSLMGPGPSRELMRLVLSGFPTVLMDRHFVDFPTYAVHADDVQGGYLATEHLIQRGRHRVAFVSDLQNTATRARFEGYREALGRHELPFRRDLVSEVLPPEDATQACVQALLERSPRPDGIFFGNDLRALLGIQTIKAAGLRVPEDVAVVGFDDMPMAPLSDPPLTTIRQDVVRMGEVAAGLLWQQLAAPSGPHDEPEMRVLPVELVQRASS